jgi:hypothetical protein
MNFKNIVFKYLSHRRQRYYKRFYNRNLKKPTAFQKKSETKEIILKNKNENPKEFGFY